MIEATLGVHQARRAGPDPAASAVPTEPSRWQQGPEPAT
jgi:hypothetical protein